MLKLYKDSPAMKLLRQKFEKEELTGSEKPKQVWESEPLFQQHMLSTFRAQYYQLRKNYDQRKKHVSEQLNRRCTNNIGQDEHIIVEDTISTEEKVDTTGREGLDIVLNQNEFRPLYVLFQWMDPSTTRKMLTCVTVLPSGVSQGQFAVHIVECGDVLELRVCWPKPLLEMDFLHKIWLTSGELKNNHPKFGGFHSALKKFRQRATDNIYSTARIVLPFTVQTRLLATKNLGWLTDDTKVVYLEMEESFVDEYSKVNNTEKFVVA